MDNPTRSFNETAFDPTRGAKTQPLDLADVQDRRTRVSWFSVGGVVWLTLMIALGVIMARAVFAPYSQFGNLRPIHQYIDSSCTTCPDGFTPVVRGAAVLNNGQLIAIALESALEIRSATDGSLQMAIETGTINHIAASTNIVATSDGTTTKLWNAADGALLSSIDAEGAFDLAFSADGNWLAIAGDSAVQVLNVGDGSLRHINLSGVKTVAFSADNRLLLTASADEVVRWKVADGEKLDTLGVVNLVAASASGRIAGPEKQFGDYRFSSSDIVLWAGTNPVEVLDWNRNADKVKRSNKVTSLSFSPSGTHLAASYEQFIVAIWSMTNNRVAHSNALPLHHPVAAVEFLPNGNDVLVWSASGLYIWSP